MVVQVVPEVDVTSLTELDFAQGSDLTLELIVFDR